MWHIHLVLTICGSWVEKRTLGEGKSWENLKFSKVTFKYPPTHTLHKPWPQIESGFIQIDKIAKVCSLWMGLWRFPQAIFFTWKEAWVSAVFKDCCTVMAMSGVGTSFCPWNSSEQFWNIPPCLKSRRTPGLAPQIERRHQNRQTGGKKYAQLICEASALRADVSTIFKMLAWNELSLVDLWSEVSALGALTTTTSVVNLESCTKYFHFPLPILFSDRLTRTIWYALLLLIV